MRPLCDIPWEELTIGDRVQVTSKAETMYGSIVKMENELITIHWDDRNDDVCHHHVFRSVLLTNDRHVGPWEPRKFPPSYHA